MPDGLWVSPLGGIYLEFLDYKFCNDIEDFRRNLSLHAASLMSVLSKTKKAAAALPRQPQSIADQ